MQLNIVHINRDAWRASDEQNEPRVKSLACSHVDPTLVEALRVHNPVPAAAYAHEPAGTGALANGFVQQQQKQHERRLDDILAADPDLVDTVVGAFARVPAIASALVDDLELAKALSREPDIPSLARAPALARALARARDDDLVPYLDELPARTLAVADAPDAEPPRSQENIDIERVNPDIAAAPIDSVGHAPTHPNHVDHNDAEATSEPLQQEGVIVPTADAVTHALARAGDRVPDLADTEFPGPDDAEAYAHAPDSAARLTIER